MGYNCVLVHYAEIGLKGKNRPFFERRLSQNVRRALRAEDIGRVEIISGRIVVNLKATSNPTNIISSLSKLFGVSWFAPAYATERDVDSIGKTVLHNVKSLIPADKTMKVLAKRADKSFPLTSLELGRVIGAQLVKEYGLKASMGNPTLKVFIEVTDRGAYVFFERFKGLGGLPVGSSGRVLALLSGGIDSAVAAWLMMKRGCSVEFLHFHPFPTNGEAINSKVGELIRALTTYSFESTAHFVPATPFQLFTMGIPARYDLILFRSFMLRIAEKIAQQRGVKAIGTGDNLNQVASQTLENLQAVEDSTSFPIFRPLLTYDKEEIIEFAKRIGTYPISIRPYKDCCSMIARHPATKASVETVRRLEGEVDMGKLVDETLGLVETVEFKH